MVPGHELLRFYVGVRPGSYGRPINGLARGVAQVEIIFFSYKWANQAIYANLLPRSSTQRGLPSVWEPVGLPREPARKAGWSRPSCLPVASSGAKAESLTSSVRGLVMGRGW